MKNRRTFLQAGLGLTAAAAAAGVGPRWLRDRIISRASGEGPLAPQILIMATSSEGDPVNASIPGSYRAGVDYPDDPAFAPMEFFGDPAVQGAALWGKRVLDGQTLLYGLHDDLRERLAFIHHRTEAVAHSEYDRTMRLRGKVKGPAGTGEEMLPSAIAQELALVAEMQNMATDMLPEPICLGPERMTIGGSPLSPLRPSALEALFKEPPDAPTLRAMRAKKMDEMYLVHEPKFTRAQKAFMARYRQSGLQAVSYGEKFAGVFEALGTDLDKVDGTRDQIIAAVALAKERVAHVITIHLPFGGDTHKDSNFALEVEQSIESIKDLNFLWEQLTAAGLKDSVTFAMFNVFGRSLGHDDGRSHNPHHNVMLMFGPHVKAGVAGGLDKDLRSTSFDPSTGKSMAGAAITAELGAAAAGITLMHALGIDPLRAKARIPEGIPIDALLSAP